MLRGQIPQDRDPQEIVFDKLEDVDDMWTHLFHNLLSEGDQGELWYWGGTRKKDFAVNFTERWVPNFATYDEGFEPDVIFCRGGFPEYHHVLKRFPNAFKIYYGAGARYMPQNGFFDYDLILQDSYWQVEECKKVFPNHNVSLFIKPAADNIFYPHEVEKEYDICFPANGRQAAFKGHPFVYDTVPKDLKVLNLGNPSNLKVPSNVTSYRVLRPEMAKHISKCRLGIVVANSSRDSCPRVIPEMLACDIPIVVLEDTRFWRDKYVNSKFSSSCQLCSGESATKENFWDIVKYTLESLEIYQPRKYYDLHLSLSVAAKFIRNKIEEVRNAV